MIKIDKNKDLADLKTLLRRLEVEGRRFEEGNAFDRMLGDEKFPFQTRRIVQEIMSILQDSPEFVDEIPERLKHFFEGWNLPKTKTAGETAMDKTNRIAEKIVARELVAAARLMNAAYDSLVMKGYEDELNRRMEAVRQRFTVLRSTIQKVGTIRNNSQDVSDALVLAGDFSNDLAKAVSKLKYEIDTAFDYVVRTFGSEDQ